MRPGMIFSVTSLARTWLNEHSNLSSFMCQAALLSGLAVYSLPLHFFGVFVDFFLDP
jgi:hypothetical protein